MKLNEWFDNLFIEDDFDEIHSVYRAISDDGGEWGYEVRKHSNGQYSIIDSDGNKASYSGSEKNSFLDYLDEKYGEGSVDGKWVRLEAFHKDD